MKILIISTVGLIYDGITSVILNNVSAMDRTGLEIHIAETIRVDDGIRRKFEELGCRMVGLPDRKKNTLRYFFRLAGYIRREHIEAVHANGNSATLAIEMLASLLGGCRKRIAHSHNTRCDQVRADKMLRPLFYRLYTEALACGKDAGRWLFGDRPFTVLKNGRDIGTYRYDPTVRESMRVRLGIKKEPVFAHVGGFVPQKNHTFLAEIYGEIAKRMPEARFFFVGDGPLRKEIEEKAGKLGIGDRTSFTGIVENVSEYLQAFDVMIFPSLFEGLPLAVIEWQLAGLPCLISDVITDECVISENVCFFSLDKSPAKWAEEAINMAIKQNKTARSETAVRITEERGYDIADSAAQLRAIYLR